MDKDKPVDKNRMNEKNKALAKFNEEHKVVYLEINKQLHYENISDAAKYAWRASKGRIDQAEYVVPTFHGVPLGVLKPTKEWTVIKKGKHKGRVTTELEDVSKNHHNIEKANVYDVLETTSRNPVKYGYKK